ncbi:MAG: short-chain dehydrogenase [Crocinitomicaceae bacterium]|nr:short-chain dehydrogenase [Crocinitomicaceae bacterium]
MYDLKGKNAVVTGGNSGMGYHIAQQLKEAGANVIIVGRSEEKVSQSTKELNVTGKVADVSQSQQIELLAQEINNEINGVDILVVNAGTFLLQPIGQLTTEVFDATINVNLRGAVFTIEKFASILNSGASVVVMSSVSAHVARDNTAIYGASKAALNAYAKSAANVLSERNIRVNIVSPGPTDTPIFSKMGLPESHSNAVKENIKQLVPLGRLAEPNEIAELVLYLSSPKATYITGSEFVIDGGALVR